MLACTLLRLFARTVHRVGQRTRNPGVSGVIWSYLFFKAVELGIALGRVLDQLADLVCTSLISLVPLIVSHIARLREYP